MSEADGGFPDRPRHRHPYDDGSEMERDRSPTLGSKTDISWMVDLAIPSRRRNPDSDTPLPWNPERALGSSVSPDQDVSSPPTEPSECWGPEARGELASGGREVLDLAHVDLDPGAHGRRNHQLLDVATLG